MELLRTSPSNRIGKSKREFPPPAAARSPGQTNPVGAYAPSSTNEPHPVSSRLTKPSEVLDRCSAFDRRAAVATRGLYEDKYST